MNLMRILAEIHGHVGVLATASLLHPAILLRKGQRLSRGGRWSIALTTAFAVLAFALGLVIYGDYRSSVKRGLFMANLRAGYLFETKEHLAFVAISLALGAGVCAWLAPPEARDLRRAAAAAYLSAMLIALTVAGLGVFVTAVHTFAE